MSDEQQILDVMASWQRATAQGDLPTVLGLMTEDVVFLVPGQPPIRGRDAFAAGFKLMLEHGQVAASGDVQEIEVIGDWAYCWNHLTVTMTPHQVGATPRRRSGPTLTILRKSNGRWQVARDANMLTLEP